VIYRLTLSLQITQRIYDLACGSGEVTLFFDKLAKVLFDAEKLPEDHIVIEATDPFTYKYGKVKHIISRS